MTNETLVSPDFVRSAYRVLLQREVESDQVVQGSLGMSEHGFVAAILRSQEFSHGKIAALLAEADRRAASERPKAVSQTRKQQEFQQLCMSFKKYDGPGAPGFFTDFLGVKTRISYLPHVGVHDGAVFGYPGVEPQGVGYGIEEWTAALQSVLEAKDRLVVVELGAGWGPWLVTGAIAARQRGISDIQLAAVEGSADHYGYLLQHLTDNGIDPSKHFLFHGVAGTEDGTAVFPKLPDPQKDWGAQAIFPSDAVTPGLDQDGKLVDYRGLAFDDYETVPSISLSTLLQRYQRVDLVHCDIQDSEGDVIPRALEQLNRTVRRVAVGTHSRRSEWALLDAFAAAGWILESDAPCRYIVANKRVVLVSDGVQVWANPRLASGQ